jgi:hypothetical protein
MARVGILGGNKGRAPLTPEEPCCPVGGASVHHLHRMDEGAVPCPAGASTGA